MAVARTTCAIQVMSATVQPLVPQGESRVRLCRSGGQDFFSPSAPLLKCLAGEKGVGRVRSLPRTVGNLGLSARALSSSTARGAEDVKRRAGDVKPGAEDLKPRAEDLKPRGRPKKKQVTKPTGAESNGSATVVEESHNAERPSHLFQYPEGVSEATVLEYDSTSQLAHGFAEYVSRLSKEAVYARRVFTIALSGGSAVKALDVLTREPYRSCVHWRQWHVFWVDERVVPLDHKDSNYKLAKEEFLSKVPIAQPQIHAIEEFHDPSTAASAYEDTLRKLVKRKVLPLDSSGQHPRFDLILLGLGPDGHVASLFPNSQPLAEKNRWVVPVTNSPKPPPKRITMSLPLINAAANAAFVVLGSSKAFVLQRVLERPALPGSLPAQLVRLSDGELEWHCDKEATSSLAREDWSDPKKFPFINYSSPAK